ncbi:helix-turn-helix transcriptional regulator [Rossellomorea vietnamensis]|nr:helix-turn-helix transcriptional regulator [Rossellomorea vietnamensis]
MTKSERNNKLREIRTERKMTQKEMADFLGYSLEHYNKVENGTFDKVLPFSKAAKLAKEYDLTFNEIFLNNN